MIRWTKVLTACISVEESCFHCWKKVYQGHRRQATGQELNAEDKPVTAWKSYSLEWDRVKVEGWPNQGIGLNGSWEGKDLAVGNREEEKRQQLVMHRCKHLHWWVTELGEECGESLKILDREACLGRLLCVCVCVCLCVYIYKKHVYICVCMGGIWTFQIL